jgi:hypothetical protein
MANMRRHARSSRKIRVLRMSRMSKILAKPEASLWVFSISQAVAMFAFNLLLRAAVS